MKLNKFDNDIQKDIPGVVIINTLGMSVPFFILSFLIFCTHASFVYLGSTGKILFVFQTILFIFGCFYCFMMLYDKKLFEILLTNPDKSQEFDETLRLLWNKKIVKNKTIEMRIKGSTRFILYFTFIVLFQILLLCICVIN